MKSWFKRSKQQGKAPVVSFCDGSGQVCSQRAIADSIRSELRNETVRMGAWL